MPRVALLLGLGLVASAGPAFAQQAFVGPDLSPGIATTTPPEGGPYVHGFGTVSFGKGFRFNNPYRLAKPIGDSPESVSFTAGYLDLGLGATFGPVKGLQHGGEVALAIATDGISQQVLGLSYVALWPLADQALLRGRAGFPIVLGPDANIGLEVAAGGAWLFTGGLGVSAELVGSLYYGAATLDASTSAIPLLTFELGVWIDYEVLP